MEEEYRHRFVRQTASKITYRNTSYPNASVYRTKGCLGLILAFCAQKCYRMRNNVQRVLLRDPVDVLKATASEEEAKRMVHSIEHKLEIFSKAYHGWSYARVGEDCGIGRSTVISWKPRTNCRRSTLSCKTTIAQKSAALFENRISLTSTKLCFSISFKRGPKEFIYKWTVT